MVKSKDLDIGQKGKTNKKQNKENETVLNADLFMKQIINFSLSLMPSGLMSPMLRSLVSATLNLESEWAAYALVAVAKWLEHCPMH